AHFQRRSAIAVAVLVLAGVHVTHHDHRRALAQRGTHAGDQLPPAIDGDEQRVAMLPAAVTGAATRIAGHPEFDDLLIADLAALRVVDDVTDDGEGGFEHG